MVGSYKRSSKENEDVKEGLKRQVVEIDKKIDRLEERLIMEEITLDLYTKYLGKFKAEKLDLERALLKTGKKVSNLEECVDKAIQFMAKLPSLWKLLPYKDKQIFQNLVFPEGFTYNKKTGESRTKKVNSVFIYVAQLMRDVAKIKMGESKLIFDIPHLVVPLGIEPSTY